MKRRISFIEEKNKLIIKVNRNSLIIDLVSYISTVSIVGIPFILFLRYGGSYASTVVIILLSSIVLIFSFFILRYYFKVQEVRITKTEDSYQFNSRETYELNEIKNFLVYRFVGEPLIDFYGHLYLTVGQEDLLLSYNLTYNEILSVTQKMSIFFQKNMQIVEKDIL